MIDQLVEEMLRLPYWTGADPARSALLILPGVQEYRIPEGVRYWPEKAKHLWAAGTRGDPFYTRREILDIVHRVTAFQGDTPLIENGGWANNTVDQMCWAVELLKKNPEVNHVIVNTAAYHVPRCVLTLVRMMKQQHIVRVVSGLPLRHPDGPFPESAAWKEEMRKISEYQQKGDVATWEQWANYCSWWRRPYLSQQ